MRAASSADMTRVLNWLKDFVQNGRNWNYDPTQWSEVIIHLIEQIMDEDTWKSWGVQVQHPDIKSLMEFIDRRIRRRNVRAQSPVGPGRARSYSKAEEMKKPCPRCGGDHPLYKCEPYTTKNVSEREAQVKALGVCPNCLKTGHALGACVLGPCRNCPGLQRHHSTLCTELEKRSLSGHAAETVAKINPFARKNVTSTVTSVSMQSTQQQQLPLAQEMQVDDQNDESQNLDAEMPSAASGGSEMVTVTTSQEEMETGSHVSETPVGVSTADSGMMPAGQLHGAEQFMKMEIPMQKLQSAILQCSLPQNLQRWHNETQRAIAEAALKRSPTRSEEETLMKSDDEVMIQDQQAVDQINALVPPQGSEVGTNAASDEAKEPRAPRSKSKGSRKEKRDASKKRGSGP